MKAKQGVVDLLNKLLTEELTVINQYFLHAKMCKNWGYENLHHHVLDRSYGEMKDAKHVIDHILFLEGLPKHATAGNRQDRGNRTGTVESRPGQGKSHGQDAHRSIQHCTKVGDFSTRHMLEDMVKDEEEHMIGSKRSWKASSKSGCKIT